MAWLRKAPTAVVVTAIIGAVVIALATLATFVVLSINGQDTTDFRNWVQTIGITVLVPLLGINTVASVVGANSAAAAEDQTNGHLHEKDATISRLTDQLRDARGGSTR